MILASCCGPFPLYDPPAPITPDDLLTWVWIGACCALLMLWEAVLAYRIRRVHGEQRAHAGRHPFVVLALLWCAFATGAAIYAWTLYQSASAALALYQSGWTLQGPSDATARLLNGYLPFGVAALIGTIVLLAAGVVALLLPDERPALSHPIDAHPTDAHPTEAYPTDSRAIDVRTQRSLE